MVWASPRYSTLRRTACALEQNRSKASRSPTAFRSGKRRRAVAATATKALKNAPSRCPCCQRKVASSIRARRLMHLLVVTSSYEVSRSVYPHRRSHNYGEFYILFRCLTTKIPTRQTLHDYQPLLPTVGSNQSQVDPRDYALLFHPDLKHACKSWRCLFLSFTGCCKPWVPDR